MTDPKALIAEARAEAEYQRKHGGDKPGADLLDRLAAALEEAQNRPCPCGEWAMDGDVPQEAMPTRRTFTASGNWMPVPDTTAHEAMAALDTQKAPPLPEE